MSLGGEHSSSEPNPASTRRASKHTQKTSSWQWSQISIP